MRMKMLGVAGALLGLGLGSCSSQGAEDSEGLAGQKDDGPVA